MKDPYHPIADIYDTLVGRRAEPAIVRRLLRQYCPGARTVLELACGSGAILSGLPGSLERTGLDMSEAMLRVARKKVPGACFLRGDIRSFVLKQRYDAIICLFNSMNHLLRFSEWTAVFRNVRRHLAPNGVFIFDVSTVLAVRDSCAESPVVREHKNMLSIAHFIAEPRDTVRIEIKAFSRQRAGGKWSLKETVIRERGFATATIEAALRRHFQTVAVLDPDNHPPGPHSQLLFFVAY